jgi:hypothetical protein
MESLNKQDITATNNPSDSQVPGENTSAKEKHKRIVKRGLICLAVGILLMGSSFGITFLLFQSDKPFTMLMYTMTTIGAICIFKGLADILGF